MIACSVGFILRKNLLDTRSDRCVDNIESIVRAAVKSVVILSLRAVGVERDTCRYNSEVDVLLLNVCNGQTVCRSQILGICCVRHEQTCFVVVKLYRSILARCFKFKS